MRKTILAFLCALPLALSAQQPPVGGVQNVTVDPSGQCPPAGFVQYNTVNGNLWTCGNVTNHIGTWQLQPGTGGLPAGVTSPGIGSLTGTGNFQAALLDAGGAVFNVKAYGAKGDGTTNDCTAITNTIAAMTLGGVLYFPPGNYITGTSCHMTISQPTVLAGAGRCTEDTATCVSTITSTDSSGVLITWTANYGLYRDIGFVNSAASPTAGSAILYNGSITDQRVDCSFAKFTGFYDDVDAWTGGTWVMNGCSWNNPVNDGLSIQNTVNQDSGDWTVTNSFSVGQLRAGQSGIHVKGGNAGLIDKTTIIGQPVGSGIVNGVLIDSCYASANSLIISNSVIQEMQGPAVNGNPCSTYGFANLQIVNSDLAPIGSNPAVNGSYLYRPLISGGQLYLTTTSQAAIVFSHVTSYLIEPYQINGSNSTANSFTSSSGWDYSTLLNGVMPTGVIHGNIPFSTGALTSVDTTQYYMPFYQIAAQKISQIQASASSFTCTGNPVIALIDCGTSAACSSPTTLQSLTISSGGSIIGTGTSATIPASHWIAWRFTGGTCSALNLSGQATY